jgi:aspartyl-tRNA(Asn)/glutamyl-tRNA(Gln) amidotransferase subunit C
VRPLTVKISEKEVRYIAELANLRLRDEELGKYAADLEEILTYVEKLNELDTADVEPMAQVIYPGSETATLRDDDVGLSFSQDLALRSAPKAGAGHFKVPRVIER